MAHCAKQQGTGGYMYRAWEMLVLSRKISASSTVSDLVDLYGISAPMERTRLLLPVKLLPLK